MIVKNDINELNKIYSELDRISKEHGFSEALYNELCLCVEEVFSNIIKFAWDDDKEHNIEIFFEYNEQVKKFTITIVDDGKPFNPLEVEAPDLSLDLFDREIGGLGIFIVTNIMNKIEYNRLESKNKFKMTKDVDQCNS